MMTLERGYSHDRQSFHRYSNFKRDRVINSVLMQIKTNQQISQVWHALESPPAHQRFNADMVAALPAPVQRYFLHAIAPGTPLATSVKLEMQGQFRLGEDKPWLAMRAQEILTPKGFVWKAVVGRALQFKGADYYINNSGRMQFKMWGLIPLVNVHSKDTTRSALDDWGQNLSGYRLRYCLLWVQRGKRSTTTRFKLAYKLMVNLSP
jgi:hypothetical protein